MPSAKPSNPELNWHLSAMKISQKTIAVLEKTFLFQRDAFTNNTRCEATIYHGTFAGTQEAMTRKCWDDIVSLLAADQNFEGDLEEEAILPQYCEWFSNEGDDAIAIDSIPAPVMTPCPVGVYKECDIHLKVVLDKTKKSVRQALDALGLISFDRPTDDRGGFNRIYTLTFQSLKDGLIQFENMKRRLSQVKGIEARLKLEIATCFYRQPATAQVLPIVLTK